MAEVFICELFGASSDLVFQTKMAAEKNSPERLLEILQEAGMSEMEGGRKKSYYF
jgi:hypothetical protein